MSSWHVNDGQCSCDSWIKIYIYIYLPRELSIIFHVHLVLGLIWDKCTIQQHITPVTPAPLTKGKTCDQKGDREKSAWKKMNIFHDHKCESKPWYIPLGSLHNSLQMNVNLPKIWYFIGFTDPQIMLVPYQSISLKISPKNGPFLWSYMSIWLLNFGPHPDFQTDHDRPMSSLGWPRHDSSSQCKVRSMEWLGSHQPSPCRCPEKPKKLQISPVFFGSYTICGYNVLPTIMGYRFFPCFPITIWKCILKNVDIYQQHCQISLGYCQISLGIMGYHGIF